MVNFQNRAIDNIIISTRALARHHVTTRVKKETKLFRLENGEFRKEAILFLNLITAYRIIQSNLVFSSNLMGTF